MLKIEYVWRELLYQAIEKAVVEFTLTQLAQTFNLSTSVVAHALHPLRDLHIVNVGKVQSRMRDVERLLFFWTTRRNVKNDIIYQTYSPLFVFEREALMPASVFPTAYSACRLYYDEIPADYEKVYFYSHDIEEVKKRFPRVEKKEPNIFILKADHFFTHYPRTTLAQIFVDLWNLPDWYSKEYLDVILLKIKQQIGE